MGLVLGYLLDLDGITDSKAGRKTTNAGCALSAQAGYPGNRNDPDNPVHGARIHRWPR